MAKSGKSYSKAGKSHSTKKMAPVAKTAKAAAASALTRDTTTGRYVGGAVTARRPFSDVTTRPRPKQETIGGTAVQAKVLLPELRADPLLLEPYDWGPGGIPEGKPLQYIPGKGFVLED